MFDDHYDHAAFVRLKRDLSNSVGLVGFVIVAPEINGELSSGVLRAALGSTCKSKIPKNRDTETHDTSFSDSQEDHMTTNISNETLIAEFHQLVRSERKITLQILQMVAEIDRRKIFLARAYPSLFEFLTKEFGYRG